MPPSLSSLEDFSLFRIKVLGFEALPFPFTFPADLYCMALKGDVGSQVPLQSRKLQLFGLHQRLQP